MSVRAYIGLGANLGDPIEQIVSARKGLAEFDGVIDIRSSSLFLSSPVGYSDQPVFVNCVVEMPYDGDCYALFEQMQILESALGRLRDPKNQNAPRLIDIDLLLFGDSAIDESDLIVPHPRMLQRLFVLLPLFELRPDLTQKLSGKSLADKEKYFPGQSLLRLAL